MSSARAESIEIGVWCVCDPRTITILCALLGIGSESTQKTTKFGENRHAHIQRPRQWTANNLFAILSAGMRIRWHWRVRMSDAGGVLHRIFGDNRIAGTDRAEREKRLAESNIWRFIVHAKVPVIEATATSLGLANQTKRTASTLGRFKRKNVRFLGIAWWSLRVWRFLWLQKK